MVIKRSIYIKKNARSLILVLVVMLFFRMEVVPQGLDNFPMFDSLPLNPDITYGKLENGFTYYICKNTSIKDDMVLMEFIVKGGSFDEDQDQKEIAHAIEHIPFYSTKHYLNGIWEVKDKDKLDITKDKVNATTSGDYTKYHFNFRRDNINGMKAGLLWFEDIAGNLNFTPHNITQVTNEVFEEFRYRTRGIMTDISNSYRPGLFPGMKDLSNPSKFLRNHTPKVFKRFYKDWYRPNNMALFVMGNVAKEEAEIIEEIKSRFSELKNPSPERKKTDLAAQYLHQEKKRIFIQDKDSRKPGLKFYFRLPKQKLLSKNDFHNNIIEGIIAKLLDRRLKGLEKSYNPIGRNIITERRRGGYPVFSIDMKIDSPVSLQYAVQGVIKELKRITEYGFTTQEFIEVQASLKKSVLENSNVENKTLLSGCREHYLYGEAFPKGKPEMLLDILNHIEIGEVNRTFSDLFTSYQVMDLVFISPRSVGNLQAHIIDTWKKDAWEAKVSPYQELQKMARLMKDKVINQLKEDSCQRKEIKEVGVTELTLTNGVKVVLKPFKPKGIDADKIMFQGFSPGGAHLYKGENYISAINAANMVSHAGIGGYDKFQLSEYLQRNGSRNVIEPYISSREEGIRGGYDKKHLEELLQMIYLYFTKPNKGDIEVFRDYILQRENFLLQQADNDQLLEDAIANALGDIDHVSLHLQLKKLRKMDLEKVYEIYKERFANAGDFTFVFTGDFDVETVIPLIGKYLGALPDGGKREFRRMKTDKVLHGPYAKDIYASEGYKGAYVKLCFIEEDTLTLREKTALRILTKVLTTVLQNRLRYQESKIYHARVSREYYTFPDWYKITMSFECELTDVESLIDASWEELKKIEEQGVQHNDFKEAVNMIRGYYYSAKHTNLNNSRVLLDLVKQYRNNNQRIKNTFLLQDKYLDEIRLSEVNNLAKRILQEKNYFRFVLKESDKMM